VEIKAETLSKIYRYRIIYGAGYRVYIDIGIQDTKQRDKRRIDNSKT